MSAEMSFVFVHLAIDRLLCCCAVALLAFLLVVLVPRVIARSFIILIKNILDISISKRDR